MHQMKSPFQTLISTYTKHLSEFFFVSKIVLQMHIVQKFLLIRMESERGDFN